MRDVDELRPLTAGRLLTLWREHREEEPLERALLCNARVLAESCFYRGEPAFGSSEEVLEELTGRQMESLLRALGPYLSKQKLQKLERAMHAAKMAGIASEMVNVRGQSPFSRR